MTANKDFKRVVRSRAAKTGESYASARRHLLTTQEAQMSNTATLPVEDRQWGYTLALPQGWHRVPTDPFNKKDEVGRFTSHRDGVHLAIVFRSVINPDVAHTRRVDQVVESLRDIGFT